MVNKYTMQDGAVIIEHETFDKKTGEPVFEYYRNGAFYLGVLTAFSRDDLQRLYNQGYFGTPAKKPSAKSRASMKYNAGNTKQIKLALNMKTDADIISFLAGVENVQGYIKSLIRENMQ